MVHGRSVPGKIYGRRVQLVSDMVVNEEGGTVLLAGGEVVVTLTARGPFYLSQESENTIVR